MKKAIAALAILATLALTGCAASDPDTRTGSPSGLTASTITLPDGRKVTCVKYDSNNCAGGLTCDWAGAK